MEFNNTIQALQTFGRNVVKEGRGILKRKKKNASGKAAAAAASTAAAAKKARDLAQKQRNRKHY